MVEVLAVLRSGVLRPVARFASGPMASVSFRDGCGVLRGVVLCRANAGQKIYSEMGSAGLGRSLIGGRGRRHLRRSTVVFLSLEIDRGFDLLRVVTFSKNYDR